MILLIGYGNTLRGDDGLGPALVERLVRCSSRDDLRPVVCHQLTPELALELAAADVDAVLFADAGAAPPPDGEIVQLRPLEPKPAETAVGHFGDPAALLFLAERLYGRCPPAWMITLPGRDFGFSDTLSQAAQEMLAAGEGEALSLLAQLS